MTDRCPHCGKPLADSEPQPDAVLRGQQAYELRSQGLAWAEVAKRMGYEFLGSKGAAYHLADDWAKRYGKPWPPWVPPVKVT